MKNKNQEYFFSQKQENFLCRLVFSIILLDLVFTAFSNTLIHQMQAPFLKFAYVDPSFWLMHLLAIPEFISSHFYVAWFWDIVLFASCIGIIIFPRKKWLVLTFIVFYFVYYIIFNSYGAHHTHSLIPILITPVAFLFSKKSFSFAWQGLRYFLLFSYSAAFLWKFFRFSWLQSNQGILILKKNLTPYLLFNPNSFLAEVYWWFLNHPFLVEVIFLSGIILEGVFIIGFFTRKYDKALFFISLILPLGFWFMADAVFYEMVILSLTLLPVSTIEKFTDSAAIKLLYKLH